MMRKMNASKVIIALLVVAAIAGMLYLFFGYSQTVQTTTIITQQVDNTTQPNASSEEFFLSLPSGFSATLFTDQIGSGPRLMTMHQGVLYASVPDKGQIVALPDANRDGIADAINPILQDLNRPHGLEFYEQWLYVAETDKVSRFSLDENGMPIQDSKEVLIDSLPTDGHWTKTIKINNATLYLAMGSSCNVCHEDDERRAAITQCNLDGTNCTLFAQGLRNAVGFIFVNDTIYATDNGRDWSGPNTPPEEVNIIQQGQNYGWPLCYGNKIHDNRQYIRDPCEDTKAPLVQMQAHSAPLGLAYYNGTKWPAEYRNSLFVAFHGSWNRAEKTGYKVVRIDLDDEQPQAKDFAQGWLTEGEEVLGRPVDIVFDEEENMYVSDDGEGKIYRIEYSQ